MSENEIDDNKIKGIERNSKKSRVVKRWITSAKNIVYHEAMNVCNILDGNFICLIICPIHFVVLYKCRCFICFPEHVKHLVCFIVLGYYLLGQAENISVPHRIIMFLDFLFFFYSLWVFHTSFKWWFWTKIWLTGLQDFAEYSGWSDHCCGLNVTIFPLISRFPTLFTKPFGIVPRSPITNGITVTLCSKHFSIVSFSWIFAPKPAGAAKEDTFFYFFFFLFVFC